MLKYNGGTKVMSFANYKGGVGKTTTTAMVGTSLAKLGYKVLTVDLDPQANLTTILYKTAGLVKDGKIIINKSLMESIRNDKSLIDSVVPILQAGKEGKLDILPSSYDFINYEYFLYKQTGTDEKKISFLKPKIDELRPYYDFIFLDVPPALGMANLSAFYACDDIIAVMKTSELSFEGVGVLINYINTMLYNNNLLDSSTDTLGILPVIEENNSDLDVRVVRNAREKYGKYVFSHVIQKMKRVERYSVTGITYDQNDQWDRRAERQFNTVSRELINRLEIDDKGEDEA